MPDEQEKSEIQVQSLKLLCCVHFSTPNFFLVCCVHRVLKFVSQFVAGLFSPILPSAIQRVSHAIQHQSGSEVCVVSMAIYREEGMLTSILAVQTLK
jgi:hypothetical protein